MINEKTVLGLIPARGGSKRVLRKNLKPFRGKPLLLWSIEQAKCSKYIDLLAVSSEDKEIQELVRSTNTHVIERPSYLATDEATCEDVLRHALTIFACDWVVLLQPTSPLRTSEDIDGCLERAQFGDACISVDLVTRKTNGAVYCCRGEWLDRYDFVNGGTMKYIMDDDRSLDINEESEFLWTAS